MRLQRHGVNVPHDNQFLRSYNCCFVGWRFLHFSVMTEAEDRRRGLSLKWRVAAIVSDGH